MSKHVKRIKHQDDKECGFREQFFFRFVFELTGDGFDWPNWLPGISSANLFWLIRAVQTRYYHSESLIYSMCWMHFVTFCDPCSHAHTLQHSPLPGDLTWFDVLICCYMTSLLKQGRSFKAHVFGLVPTLNLVKPQLFADTKSLAGHLSLLCLYPKPSSEEVLWSEMRSLEGKKPILACLSRFILLHPFHLNHLKVNMK